MTINDKAQRATVQIGPLSVDGFQMPDGSYRMSQTQAAESVGKSQRNAGRFLESKGIKALRGEGYTPDTIEVDSLLLRLKKTLFFEDCHESQLV